MMRRLLSLAALAGAAAVLLGGCAAMNQLDNDVSTYSQWPPQRKPASYAFERLPSQQARPAQQQQLEDAARASIERAGFSPAADPASAEFSVQLGARTSANEGFGFDDPFWWRGPHFGYGFYGYGRFGRGFGPGWYGHYDTSSYEREVAVMIRDRQSGQVLYEAHADNDGVSPSFDGLLPAMFEAAMKDFPNPGVNPRRVTVELSKTP